MKFTKRQIERYSRQIILKKIGAAGQKKLLKSSVLIVGSGGLGSPIAIYLAALGIGKIGIIDKDNVEVSNLSRQIIFNTNDIKKKKSHTAINKLKKINPDIKFESFSKNLTKMNINHIGEKFDLIVDGSDNFKTRFLINDYCLKNKKILISAAINKFDGQIFKFNFKKKTPCFRCFMPEIPDMKNNCDTEGIISTLAGMAGTIQANEVIKTILNVKDDFLGKILVFNSLKTEFRKIKLPKNPDCIQECAKK